MIRRLAAFALAASLLHLNLVRADAVCTHHEHAPAPAQHDEHPVLPHHDVSEATTPANGGHADHESCDTPKQMDCCKALASCAYGMEIAAEMFVAVDGLPHDEAIGALINMPLGRVTTPDPPPPRA